MAEDKTLSFDSELLLLAKLFGYQIKEGAIYFLDSPGARTFNPLREAARMMAGTRRRAPEPNVQTICVTPPSTALHRHCHRIADNTRCDCRASRCPRSGEG